MDGPRGIEQLIAHSFHRCPGEQANSEIARIRDEYLLEFGAAVCYEVVVPNHEDLAADMLPRFAHHLRAKRLLVEACPELFVALFREGILYFLRSRDFVDHLLARENLTAKDVPERIEAWRRSQASEPHAPPPVAALPAPAAPRRGRA
jgi:hypothetical protein